MLNPILQTKEVDTKIISSMGTGNKMNPTQFKVADIPGSSARTRTTIKAESNLKDNN